MVRLLSKEPASPVLGSPDIHKVHDLDVEKHEEQQQRIVTHIMCTKECCQKTDGER